MVVLEELVGLDYHHLQAARIYCAVVVAEDPVMVQEVLEEILEQDQALLEVKAVVAVVA